VKRVTARPFSELRAKMSPGALAESERIYKKLSRKLSAAEAKKPRRVRELERICGELYQVIGKLADHAGVFDHPDVVRALDNASEAKLRHRDLLPWPHTPLPPGRRLRRR
jgi:hypothetical protein